MKSVTIIFVCALALGLSFLACDPKADKIRAFNDLTRTCTFQDTVITYSLFSDSLILKFAKEPKIKHWIGEICLIKSNPDEIVYIPFPNQTEEQMGHLTIKKNRMTFSGFHIPFDSVDRYSIHFRAVPNILGFVNTGEIYTPMYLFSSKPNGSNKLEVNKDVKDFRITSFDLDKLAHMSAGSRDFCLDTIYKVLHNTINGGK